MERLTEEQARQYVGKHFNILHDENPALFVVLVEALKFPLLDPWQIVATEESGVYFFNPDTNETSWELPYHASVVDLKNNFEYVWADNGFAYLDATTGQLLDDAKIQEHDKEAHSRTQVALDAWEKAFEQRVAEYQAHEVLEGEAGAAAASSSSSSTQKKKKYYHHPGTETTTWTTPRSYESSFFQPKFDPLSRLLEPEYRTYLREYEKYYKGSQSSSSSEELVTSTSKEDLGLASPPASKKTTVLNKTDEDHHAVDGGNKYGNATASAEEDATRTPKVVNNMNEAASSSSASKNFDRTPTLGFDQEEGLDRDMKAMNRSGKTGELRALAEQAVKDWDAGLALKKWMVPEQYAKYLHLEPGEETELFTKLFLRPLMPPWRAKRDEKSRVYFEHVGSIPADKKAWKHPLQSFFHELIPVVREVLQTDDLFDKKSRLVAVMQKHAGRKSLKGMGTWLIKEHKPASEDGQTPALTIYVNREDSSQERSDNPKVAACCQVYTKLWMLVTLWHSIFGEEHKCPLSDDECWSLAERLGNMVLQQQQSSVPNSEPLTAKIEIETPADTPKEDNLLRQSSLSKSSGERKKFPLNLQQRTPGDTSSAQEQTSDNNYDDEQAALGETEDENLVDPIVEAQYVSKVNQHHEQEKQLAEQAVRLQAEYEEKLREEIENAKIAFAEERRQSQVDMDEKLQEFLRQKEQEDAERNREDVSQMLAEANYQKEEELSTALEQMETRLQEQMTASLAELRLQMADEVKKMPEKRRDMELDWQRDFDHQAQRLQEQWLRKFDQQRSGAEIELQQALREIREKSEREHHLAQEKWRQRESEFVEEQRSSLENVASRSAADLATESTKLLGEHQRLVDSSLEQKRLNLEKQHAERSRHVEEQLLERKKEIARDLDARKSELEQDLVRKTKEIEFQVESRYLDQFERESQKHAEHLAAQTQELQQKAYLEVKQKQGVILDELERDAKQRQDVFLAERQLQASRLQFEAEALEETRKKAELERKRLEEAKHEADRTSNYRTQSDQMRCDTLERKMEEKLLSLERTIADNEREAQRRESELRTELDTTRKSLHESVRLLESIAPNVVGRASYGSTGSSLGLPPFQMTDPLQHSVLTTQLHASPNPHRSLVPGSAGGQLGPQQQQQPMYLPNPVLVPGSAERENRLHRISVESAATQVPHGVGGQNNNSVSEHQHPLLTTPPRGTSTGAADSLLVGAAPPIGHQPLHHPAVSSKQSKLDSKGSSQDEGLRNTVRTMQAQMEEMERRLRAEQQGDHLFGGPVQASQPEYNNPSGDPNMQDLKSFFREFQQQQAHEMAQLRSALVATRGGGGAAGGGAAGGGGGINEDSPGGLGQNYLDRVILDSVREVVSDAMTEAFVADDYQRQRRKREAFAPNNRYQFPGGGGVSPVFYQGGETASNASTNNAVLTSTPVTDVNTTPVSVASQQQQMTGGGGGTSTSSRAGNTGSRNGSKSRAFKQQQHAQSNFAAKNGTNANNRSAYIDSEPSVMFFEDDEEEDFVNIHERGSSAGAPQQASTRRGGGGPGAAVPRSFANPGQQHPHQTQHNLSLRASTGTIKKKLRYEPMLDPAAHSQHMRSRRADNGSSADFNGSGNLAQQAGALADRYPDTYRVLQMSAGF
ncbi:unnamed protein product [Amoebophrya sp. A120]|nr:unnamed protein product [Amoebophrya sp. A120]|eukprot:GSA120T00011214001.1